MTDQTPQADTNDAFTQAQRAKRLRGYLRQVAEGAVEYGGVNRDWVNSWLSKMGIEPFTGYTEYRISAPMTALFGATVTASNRTEAMAKFQEKVAQLARIGKINDCHRHGFNAYRVQLVEGTEPTFYSGPEDVAVEGADLTLPELEQAIMGMLREGVSTRGWGWSYANDALDNMDLPPLPALTVKTIEVPVAGTYKVQVRAFEGDSEEAVAQAASATVAAKAQGKQVAVNVTEIGDVVPS